MNDLQRLRVSKHQLQQLFWECTLRCNLNCKHCGSDCAVSNTTSDMPFSDFATVLDSVARNTPDTKKVLVELLGGEPLLRNDILQCGSEIKKIGFPWGIVSNGMLLTKDKFDELINAGLRSITISLDGFEDEHNWLRDHNVSFERAVNAIRCIAQSSKPISWDVITCVTKKNFRKLLYFKDFLCSIGVKRWRLFTIFPSGRAAKNPDLFLSNQHFEKLMQFIIHVKREGKIIVNYGCEGYLGKYENQVRYYPFFCQSGINVASILADGSITGCLSVREKRFIQGSIYDSDFWTVWNNEFDTFRNKEWTKKGICSNCDAYEKCLGGSMHLRDEGGNLNICRHDYLNKNNLPFSTSQC